ncbi:MAG: hypothetical protein QXR31_01850 [Zestosphaera sp.]
MSRNMTQKKKRGRPGNPPVTCPRCGRLGYRYVARRGGRLYVYYKHVDGSCYIGPVGEYSYVERFYELDLTNIEHKNYVVIARQAISYMAMRGETDRLVEIARYVINLLPPPVRDQLCFSANL